MRETNGHKLDVIFVEMLPDTNCSQIFRNKIGHHVCVSVCSDFTGNHNIAAFVVVLSNQHNIWTACNNV